MKSKRQPTEAQKQAAKERREKIRQLARQVSAMSQAERDAIAARVGIVTIEGRRLSPFNSCLLLNQSETVSVVGGFSQWRKAGRMVKKGARGLALWIPTGRESEPDTEDEQDGNRPRFMLGTVFDVTQTEEISA